jgi:hypothetical protein
LLELFWFENKRDIEIMKVTGYSSTNTVKNQRSRCMKTLRKTYLEAAVKEDLISETEKQLLISE